MYETCCERSRTTRGGKIANSPQQLDTNKEVDIVRQERGHFADNVSTQHVDESVALGGSQQDSLGTDGRGEIGDGVGRGVADRVAGDDGFAETFVLE